MSRLPAWKSALRLAVEALKEIRRTKYAAANNAFVYGFEFAVTGKKKYDEYTQAIAELERMMEE